MTEEQKKNLKVAIQRARPAFGWVEIDDIVNYVEVNFTPKTRGYFCGFCNKEIEKPEEDFKFCSSECKINNLT